MYTVQSFGQSGHTVPEHVELLQEEVLRRHDGPEVRLQQAELRLQPVLLHVGVAQRKMVKRKARARSYKMHPCYGGSLQVGQNKTVDVCSLY
jgi:hypothetical protein